MLCYELSITYLSIFFPLAIYQTCDKTRSETVVNIDDCDIRRAGIEHSQKRGKTAERRAVTDARWHGDNGNFHQTADDRRQRAFHSGDDDDDPRRLQNFPFR